MNIYTENKNLFIIVNSTNADTIYFRNLWANSIDYKIQISFLQNLRYRVMYSDLETEVYPQNGFCYIY